MLQNVLDKTHATLFTDLLEKVTNEAEIFQMTALSKEIVAFKGQYAARAQLLYARGKDDREPTVSSSDVISSKTESTTANEPMETPVMLSRSDVRQEQPFDASVPTPVSTLALKTAPIHFHCRRPSCTE